MNDETRELLSAYLDGALPEAERRELDLRLAASAELRGALEDLRAVSSAVKGLPKSSLPPGFLSRFQARRARGDAPRQNWVLLPPAARPVVAAMSIGVIALVIWDKVSVSPESSEILNPPETAKVYDSAHAPVAQLDVSRAASGAGGASGERADAKDLQIAGAAPKPARPGDKLAYLDSGSASGSANAEPKTSVAAVRRGGRAAGSPIAADAAAPGAAPAEPQLADRTRVTMSEEERSARNEAMIDQLEMQKKRMGITVLPKDQGGDSEGRRGFLGLREPPAAPMVRAPVPTLLKSAKRAAAPLAAAPTAPPASGLGRLAPDAGLVFSDASSLSSSWVLLGFPGDPPSMDFSTGRLVLIKPSATKILSVTPGPAGINVVFRSLLPDEASDPARDRVAPLPALPKPVFIYDASPQ